MQTLNSLVPIFSVIGLGMLLRWNKFLSAEGTRTFNRFAYYFALPLFLFYKLASATSQTGSANLILNTLLSTVVIIALIGWFATWVLKIPRISAGAMIQASFRGNLAFIGLPLVLFTIYDLPSTEKMAIESAILLALTPVILFYNVASVIALAAYSKKTDSSFSWSAMLATIVKNPLIWACVGGAFFQTMKWPLPTALTRTFEVVGASAFPMALLGIGSQLVSITVSKTWTRSIPPTTIKCIISPLVGWAIGCWLGMSSVELQAVLILCAAPTAVSSYVLADQMEGDADLAASSVVISTAFALLPLSVILALTSA